MISAKSKDVKVLKDAIDSYSANPLSRVKDFGLLTLCSSYDFWITHVIVFVDLTCGVYTHLREKKIK